MVRKWTEEGGENDQQEKGGGERAREFQNMFYFGRRCETKVRKQQNYSGKGGRSPKSKAAAWAVLSKMPQLQAQVGRDWSRTRTARDDVSRWRDHKSGPLRSTRPWLPFAVYKRPPCPKRLSLPCDVARAQNAECNRLCVSTFPGAC